MLSIIRRHPHLCCQCFLALLVLAVFFDALFITTDKVISAPGADLSQQFIHWRQYGFSEFGSGNLPLWNPHIFAGIPFMAGFQSALFYPLNWIYCFTPLITAINWSIALHLFLMGSFMYVWLIYRKIQPVAALAGSSMIMFSGPYFLHIYAGHLPNLCAMIWAPLIFLAVDGLRRNFSHSNTERVPIFGWTSLGAASVTMQILAGHPQYVFYNAIAIGIYSLCEAIKCRQGFKLCASVAAFYIIGAFWAAIQLLPGFFAARESIRGAGVSYQFASVFSFPPENLFSLITPFFFGPISNYWGRGFLWEMSMFVSVTGVILAAYAVVYQRPKENYTQILTGVVLFILALGSHTPLFKILYRFVPGFDSFSGNSKFIFFVSLLIIQLAAGGIDHMIKRSDSARTFSIAVAAVALVVGIFAFFLWIQASGGEPPGIWVDFLQYLRQTRESYLPSEIFQDSATHIQTAKNAAIGLFVAGGTVLLVSVLFFCRRYTRHATYAVVALAIIEMTVFAGLNRVVFPVSLAYTSGIQAILDGDSGDYRILNLLRSSGGIPAFANEGMSAGWNDLWGNDPLVSKRYAEMMAFSQSKNPADANQSISFRAYHKFLAMFRTRYVFFDDTKGQIQYQRYLGHLPHFLLIHAYRVINDRDEALDFMAGDSFDASQIAVLEDEPGLRPHAAIGQEAVRILEKSGDYYELDVNLSANGILLVTDAFDRGWQAVGQADGRENKYEIIPANYAMMGVMLPKGRHLIRLEYDPPEFSVGKLITLIAVGTYLVVMVLIIYHNYHPARHWPGFRKKTSKKGSG